MKDGIPIYNQLFWGHMEDNFWIRELGRLFKRSSEAIRLENRDEINIIVREFNEALSRLKDQHPNNPIIESTNPVDPTEERSLPGGMIIDEETTTGTYEDIREESLYEVRSNCERISNSLGYELPDASKDPNADQMVVVRMENIQETKQKGSQNVSFESVQELIRNDPEAQGYRDELTELTEKVKEELDSDEPDEGTIREYLKEAKQYSVSVTAYLTMLALQEGILHHLELSDIF